ncbi:MAG TPA: hypothetical protein VD838_16080, partial [Anaeromyxobacteraceae bacterium]|nr:hypothetical protein [Anaeromyxobacteraceae bacterium]
KPRLVAALGARYHTSAEPALLRAADVVVEATGAARIVLDAMTCLRPNGILCLTGIAAGRREETIDANALNRFLVLENNVVFGTVNANRAHYAAAADALAQAERSWLEGIVTRRVPLDAWETAYRPDAGDVKTVVDFRA